MNNKNIWTSSLYIILCISAFILLQFFGSWIAKGCYALIKGIPLSEVSNYSNSSELLSVIDVLGSLLTIVIFTRARWSKVSRDYLKARPWAVLMWTFLLTIGSILPMEFISEKANLTLPDQTQHFFELIMKTPWGYIAVAIMAPIAEELVFRGAILNKLLSSLKGDQHWIAIVLSALIFGIIHLNFVQGLHAFLIGLLLGWMFYRTGSVIPGILFHWVNNTVAFLMFHLMPQMNDGKLIDLFHGDSRLMYGGLFFSLCILIPSLFQLVIRMHKAK